MTATLAPPHRAPSAAASDDAELVAHARAGSHAAMTSLHQRYAPMVHAIILTRAPTQDADDLTQDVFLQAMARLDRLDKPAAFGAWIATIARNAARDRRRRKRTVVPLREEQLVAAATAPARIDAERVLAALRRLPESQAEILAMRLVEGMSGPEIAATTGQSHGSVRVALHRGMARLRAMLGHDDEEDEP